MLLVVGGCASGKRTFVQSLGYAPEQMANATIDDAPVIFNVQDLATSCGLSAQELAAKLLEKDVVIGNEVGSGVIPLQAKDRETRELVGALYRILAEQADAVVRMVVGIPTVLKGDPWNL